jgi:ribonuclease-3
VTRPVEALVARLGLPADPPDPRFREALTHPSSDAHPDYERLEFFGDAVLKLVVSRWLYDRHPELDEGGMSKVRARTVSDETLAIAAEALELGPHLILGAAEKKSRGREKVGILASSFEAVLGAVYLTAGDDAAEAFLERWLGPEFRRSLQLGGRENAKAVLQELTQGADRTLPAYRLVDTLGPPHDRRYVIEVLVGGEPLGRGEGPSKKAAEQHAAAEALAALRTRAGKGSPHA